jgi:hypothetical protein
MSDNAPESGSANSLDHYHGKEETGDFNAADQTVRRGARHTFPGSGGLRWKCAVGRHALATQLPVEIPVLSPLENPGVR